jgi:ATP-dependent Lhr-like helicase
VSETTPLELRIEPLETERGSFSFLPQLLQRLEPELMTHRTTLVFTNARGLAERLTWALRSRFPGWAEDIAVHHSAVAEPRRREAERRLKAGQLRAVVSSTSLELGIDIGSVDAVVLVHPPGGVVRLLQRVGRGGHGPGRPRRGLVLTAGPAELLEAAVTAAASRSAQVEPLRVPTHPLDVLCQQLVAMAAMQSWRAEEAFHLVRRAYPYRDLPRDDFDGCLDYLAGLCRDGQPWLPARIDRRGEHFVLGDARTARLLRRNLGTILTEEPRPVLLREGAQRGTGGAEREVADSERSPLRTPRSRPVGHVDEAFADRLLPGDRFLLDGRCLEFRRLDGPALLVDEVTGRPVTPRWVGEGWPLSAELARRLYVLRGQAAEALRDGPEALTDLLRGDYSLAGRAVAMLADYFQSQERVSEIPTAVGCLVEEVLMEAGADYYVHTPLNRAGNDALARVAVLRLARDRGRAAASVMADLGFALVLRNGGPLAAGELQALLAPDGFEADLAAALADSALLRERFRRVAQTGLMLLRNPLGRRRRVGGPDWAERRLFDRVRAADPECVLLRQALREVRAECCDESAARTFVEELPRRTLRCRRLARVSPFAEHWTQPSPGPAESVECPAEALQRLHEALLQGP